MSRTFPALFRSRNGTALIEFAIAAPVLVALLIGMVSYGQYFLLAHSAQQLANDAAREAIAGITAPERDTIARAAVVAGGAALRIIDPSDLSAAITEESGRIRVQVSIDASHIAILRIPIVPMPSTTIVRTAVTRVAAT